jgi:signal transduction histidine kinase
MVLQMRAAWWRRFLRLPAAHPLLTDVTLAAGLTVTSVLQGWADHTGQWRPYDVPAAVLTVLATAPTAFRRRAPVAAFLVCNGFWIASAAAGYPPANNSYGILLALYTIAALRPRWQMLACIVWDSGTWIVVLTAGGVRPVVAVIAIGVVIPAVVWKVGDGARRLALAADALARRAVLEERVRIAREMHDVIAHHMSVIAVQAGLAKYVLRSDPATADTALGTVLDSSAEALDEMRRMLGVLRAGPAVTDPVVAELAGFDPAPRLADLPELFGRVRAAGVPVQVAVTGTPRTLPPGLEVCAYRVVQESLTNVVKHGGRTTARVGLRYGTGELVVTIADDGRQLAPTGGPSEFIRRATKPATGKGLIGMRERSMLYGGTLEAAPRAGGGFEVRLTLPIEAPA